MGVPVVGGGWLPIPRVNGQYYFVDSNNGNNANDGLSIDRAFSTIDYAVGLCTANRGDVIVVMPGHVETVTAAAGLDLDVAGITIVGMGQGRNRPKINFTTVTTADMDVDAANITLVNLFFDCTSIDALAGGIDVNAADFTMLDCEIELADASGQCVAAWVSDANAHRFRIERCYFHGAGDTTALIAVDTVGGDDFIIQDCIMIGYFGTTGAIRNATTNSINYVIKGNTIINRTADGDNKTIVMAAGSVGLIINNRFGLIDSISPAPITAAAGWVGGNYSAAAVGVAAGTLI